MLARISLLFLSTFLFTVHADLPGTVAGKSVYCQNAGDVSRDAASKMDAFALNTQGTNITMNITMESMVCLQTGSTFAWRPRIFTADLPTLDRDGNPITIQYQDLQFVAVNADYVTLGTAAAQAVPVQNLNYNFDIKSSLNADDYKLLESGQTLTVHWEFFINGNESVKDANGNVTPIGQISGETFQILFKLTKVNGSYVVSY